MGLILKFHLIQFLIDRYRGYKALRRIDTVHFVVTYSEQHTASTRVPTAATNQNNTYNNGQQSMTPTEY